MHVLNCHFKLGNLKKKCWVQQSFVLFIWSFKWDVTKYGYIYSYRFIIKKPQLMDKGCPYICEKYHPKVVTKSRQLFIIHFPDIMNLRLHERKPSTLPLRHPADQIPKIIMSQYCQDANMLNWRKHVMFNTSRKSCVVFSNRIKGAWLTTNKPNTGV